MSRRIPRAMITILVVTGLSAVPARGLSQGAPNVDPSDSRLVPSPLDASDPGTTWACRLTGTDVQCAGAITITWQEQEGPSDWCSAPLSSVNGTVTRTQTRHYAYDVATGGYLEYKRLIHLNSLENLSPEPDPDPSVFVIGRLHMTWQTSFQAPGDLDSRITRKQGIDTLIKRPDGGVVLFDVGQKTEDLTTAPGEDFNFRGRWDIALGDPAVEFGKVCSALGL